jgi:DNA-binding ferritin-like protein
MTGQEVVTGLIQMREQFQTFHWQTTSYAQHKAFDWAYDTLSGHFDRFMEAFLGRNGHEAISGPFKPILLDLSAIEPETYVDHCLDTVAQLVEFVGDAEDLENILEEVTADLNKLKYLLRLS